MEMVMLKYKKALVVAGTVASFAFMMTMLFWTDDVQSIEAVSAADAIEMSRTKNEDGNGLYGNSLSGTVIIDGQAPMPHGTVIVYGSASARPIGYSSIQPGGVYFVSNLPTGDVQLVVTSHMKNFDLDRKANRSGRTHKIAKHQNKVLPRSDTLAAPDAAAAPGSVAPPDSVAATGSVPTMLGTRQQRLAEKSAKDSKIPFDSKQTRRAERMARNTLNEEKGGVSKVYLKIDELYGSLASPKKLTTYLSEGQNNFTIEIDTHGAPEVSIEEANP